MAATARAYVPAYIRRSGGNAKGATNTNILRFSVAEESAGSDIVYVPSSTLGDSFQIIKSAIYAVSLNCTTAGANPYYQISVDTVLGNAIGLAYSRAAMRSVNAGADPDSISWCGYIAAGNLVWCMHTQTPGPGTPFEQVSITKVADL